MKYQKELSILLSHECLTRICAGTAEFLENDISPGGAVKAISKAMRAMHMENKRWSDLINLFSFLLDGAIKNNSCLNATTGWENGLGEALEAKGFHEQAALIYAEAGRHCHAYGEAFQDVKPHE